MFDFIVIIQIYLDYKFKTLMPSFYYEITDFTGKLKSNNQELSKQILSS